MAKIECEHTHIMYDKINDYNFCQDCLKIFFEEYETLYKEENKNDIIDEEELNLEILNKL